MTRIIIRSKTKSEKLIMTVWCETKRGKDVKTDEQASVIGAIYKTLSYFEMDDYLHGSRHVEIIKRVYLSAAYERRTPGGKKKITNKTRAGLAMELYVGEKTLERYTNIYIKCFEKNMSDLFGR
jgi:hypothetical protein